MKGKILFVVGLGVGYVLGTRAGRERYEQIKRVADSVWNQPTVKRGVDSAKEFAVSKVGDLSGTVLDNVKDLIGNATKSSGDAKAGVRRAATAAKGAVDHAADAAEDLIDEAAEAAAKASKPSASSGPAPKGTSKPASSGS